jgi:hypothetical protein
MDLNWATGTLSLTSLFYETSDDAHFLLRRPCLITDRAGRGAEVLRFVDVLASTLGMRVTLDDKSEFSGYSAPPAFFCIDMSTTLRVLRGFSYFEGKGFVDANLYEALAHRKDLIPYAHEIDIQWTHAVFATPLEGLAHAVRTFHERVAEILPAEFRESRAVDFMRRMYSAEACALRATAAERFVGVLRGALRRDVAGVWTGGEPPDRGGEHFVSLSLRGLVKHVLEAPHSPDRARQLEQLQTWAEALVRNVWERSGSFGTYPSGRLVKVFFPAADNKKEALVCRQGNEANALPVIHLRPLAVDMTVAFRE